MNLEYLMSEMRMSALSNEKVTILIKGEQKEKTLWAGIGNTSGLHSFAQTLINEKWDKQQGKIENKLKGLIEGDKLIFYSEEYITRDRRKYEKYRQITIK